MKTTCILALVMSSAIGCTRTLHVRGHVEDTRNGTRVPYAKVIASAWDHGIFDASPHKYGTVADSNAEFTITVPLDFWIDYIDVEALSPDNRYAEKMKNEGYAALGVRELTYWQTNNAAYLYESFEGQWSKKTKWISNNGTQQGP